MECDCAGLKSLSVRKKCLIKEVNTVNDERASHRRAVGLALGEAVPWEGRRLSGTKGVVRRINGSTYRLSRLFSYLDVSIANMGWPRVRGFVPRTKVLTCGHPFCVHMGFLQWVNSLTLTQRLSTLFYYRWFVTFITFTKACFVSLIWWFVLFTSFAKFSYRYKYK